ncbi:MAG TPA: M48 family metallopeptidase [Mycobacteriales bacterium]|nr:M48 family metallopeptidase [Mycobacteriales bacterium]
MSRQEALFELSGGAPKIISGDHPKVEVEPVSPLVAAADAEPPQVEVIRSARRRRTVSAHRAGDRIVVSVPARISRAEERRWVALMVARILDGERRARPSDDELMERATSLSRRYLAGQVSPSSVRWVDNMAARWGSCTPVDGTIRLSRRLVGMPGYVVDYVLLHELAHLLVPGHGPKFWHALAGYERLERARGYLEGVASADSPS